MTGGARVLVAACATVAACGGASDDGRLEIVERDSAGVTIVENPPVAEAAGFGIVEAVPMAEIGTLEGDAPYQLYLVRDVHRFPDGRLAIANGGSNEVRFYDAAGEYLGAVGGQGDGPGEFQSLASLWARPGDTLWAYDSRHRSFTVIGPAGSFVETLPFGGGDVFRFPAGVFADGAVLGQALQVFRAGQARSGAQRAPVEITLSAPGKWREETVLGEWPGSEMFVSSTSDLMAVRGLVFGRQLFAAVSDDRAAVGTNDARSFRLLARDGTLERISRVAGPLDPVPDGAFDRYAEEVFAAPDGEHLREMWAGMFEEMPRHDTYPAFEAMRADAAGRVWLADYRGPGDEARWWTVFDSDGRMLGRVRTPDGLRVLEIGTDYVAGVVTDELEVERVRVHALRISETGEPLAD